MADKPGHGEVVERPSDDAIARARQMVDDNIALGDVDDDTAVITTGGLIGDIAIALNASNPFPVSEDVVEALANNPDVIDAVRRSHCLSTFAQQAELIIRAILTSPQSPIGELVGAVHDVLESREGMQRDAWTCAADKKARAILSRFTPAKDTDTSGAELKEMADIADEYGIDPVEDILKPISARVKAALDVDAASPSSRSDAPHRRDVAAIATPAVRDGWLRNRPEEPWMDVDTLDRVAALGPEARKVCDWACFMEGVLHRIEEFPRHEPHYPEDEQFTTPQRLAEFGLHGSVVPIDGSIEPAALREGGE